MVDRAESTNSLTNADFKARRPALSPSLLANALSTVPLWLSALLWATDRALLDHKRENQSWALPFDRRLTLYKDAVRSVFRLSREETPRRRKARSATQRSVPLMTSMESSNRPKPPFFFFGWGGGGGEEREGEGC